MAPRRTPRQIGRARPDTLADILTLIDSSHDVVFRLLICIGRAIVVPAVDFFLILVLFSVF